MSAAATEADLARHRLLKLSRRRLEKYATLLPKLLIGDAPETIHDLRVGSRRLQQIVRIIAPAGQTKKLKKVTAALRHVRQSLGPCRDLDVNLALIDSRRAQGGAGSVLSAWHSLHRQIASQREAMIGRARQEIASQDLFKFINRVQVLIEATERDTDPLEQIAAAMTASMTGWEESFAATREKADAMALHGLRIAGKKLRYRAELLADLGQAKVKPLVKILKEIQTSLGDWHDRSVLLRHVAEFIGRPGFLADHPDIGRILLAEIEKERLRADADIASTLRLASKVQAAWSEWQTRVAAK